MISGHVTAKILFRVWSNVIIIQTLINKISWNANYRVWDQIQIVLQPNLWNSIIVGIQYEYTQTQCEEGTREVNDIWVPEINGGHSKNPDIKTPLVAKNE